MKTLGILGGMGPKATAALYDRIVDATSAAGDQDHIETIVISDPHIPDRTAAIMDGRTDELRDALGRDAARLAKAGAEVVIMPCNTAHLFIEDVKEAAGCTVIDMVETAVRDALGSDPSGRLVGIMATDGTVASGIYDRALEKRGAKALYPSDEKQKRLMGLIYDDIKNGRIPGPEGFMEVISELRAGCDTIILACTELSVYRDLCPEGVRIVDAMDSLASEAVRACGAQVREDNERGR